MLVKSEQPFRVACIAPDNTWIFREMLRGFNALSQTRRWMVDRIVESGDWRAQMRGFPPQAMLVTANIAGQLTADDRAGRVVVVINGTCPGFPSVMIDDEAAGEQAAAHLLDCGLKAFAAHGVETPDFWQRRLRGFVRAVKRAGKTVDLTTATLHPDESIRVRSNSYDNVADITHRWLMELPKPVGILAGCDSWGSGLLFAARRSGLRVPEEVAVVGVDDDPFITELCFPALSSVSIPWQRMGYEAAIIMERLVSGERVSDQPVEVSPTVVRARRSSDILAVEDPDVAAALQFIRAHADQSIKPVDILRHVPVYRKKLERNFRRYVGRSITEEVRRAHVERAKQLLVATDLPMIDIASRSGFTSPAKFSVAVRRETGQSPTQYRKHNRNRGF